MAEESSYIKHNNRRCSVTDPISIDMENWRRMGISEEFAKQQERSVNALLKMGAVPTWTCTPHLAGSIPRIGEQVAYVETACVIFTNSFFGARTNREMDLSALAAGITGRVPFYGLRLEDNREGQILVNLETELRSSSDYDALGNYVGKIAGTKIPVFKGMQKDVSVQSLMQLGAALATTGAIPLFHAFDITPEIIQNPYKYGEKSITDSVTIGEEEMEKAYEQLNTTKDNNIDFVSLGCPHYTYEKVREIAQFLKGKKIKDSVEVWISVSQTVRNLAVRSGEIEVIEKSGAKVIIDTCCVLAPVKTLGFINMATDSAKAQFYVSGFGIGVRFGNTIKCLETALTGKWEE